MGSPSMSRPLSWYQQGLDLQYRMVAEVAAGGEDRLLLLEHHPVLTIGRAGSDPRVPRGALA